MSKLTRGKWGEIINRLIRKRRAKQMKVRVTLVLVMLGAFIFFSAGIAKADDLSDMKEQIKALQETINTQQQTIQALSGKIQGIETKQESQAQEIKKVPELTNKLAKLKENPVGGLLGGVEVGGHLKLALFDRTQGKRNGVDQHNNASAGFIGADGPLYLTVGKQIEDWLRIDTRLMFEVAARATPSLGSDITRTTTSTISTTVDLAYMTALLPQGYELKVGKIRPMFSEDYARETWWNELFNMPAKTCTLQSWHDIGAELYKNFDFDKWSLPVYFYLLNGPGSSAADNNEDKAVLIHVAPEFFQSKLRLLGSFGYGKWDDKNNNDVIRTEGGFDWKYKKFNLLGEYIYSLYENKVIPSTGTAPTGDGKQEGYWIKAMYTFNPKWRALIQQSYTNLYQAALTTTQSSMLSDKWYTTTLGLDYFLTPNSTIMGQYDISNGSRSDGSESLKYNRFTLGWRTTF